RVPPVVVGVCYLSYIFLGEFPGSTINQMPQIAGIDEQNFSATVSEFSIATITAHKPKGSRDLRIQKQFGRKVYNTVDQVSLNQCFSDIALTATFGSQCAFCQYKARLSAGRQVIQEMLDPGIIGISGGWCAVLPTTISTEQVATPITHIKRWIGYNVIGFQVFVGIVEKRPFVVPFHLRAVDSPDREVHLCQSPGGLVTFLSVYGN